MGISRKNIYVTVPWGINALSYRKAIVETYSQLRERPDCSS